MNATTTTAPATTAEATAAPQIVENRALAAAITESPAPATSETPTAAEPTTRSTSGGIEIIPQAPKPTTDRCEKCARCFFAISELVPDPTAPFRHGSKPRVHGYRCHISRPSTNGFPIVRADEFCGMFTDAKTRKQPLARLLMPLFATANGPTIPTRAEVET